MLFGVGVLCRVSYSVVNYLYVSLSGGQYHFSHTDNGLFKQHLLLYYFSVLSVWLILSKKRSHVTKSDTLALQAFNKFDERCAETHRTLAM